MDSLLINESVPTAMRTIEAMKVIRAFCESRWGQCGECIFVGVCLNYFKEAPENWR